MGRTTPFPSVPPATRTAPSERSARPSPVRASLSPVVEVKVAVTGSKRTPPAVGPPLPAGVPPTIHTEPSASTVARGRDRTGPPGAGSSRSLRSTVTPVTVTGWPTSRPAAFTRRTTSRWIPGPRSLIGSQRKKAVVPPEVAANWGVCGAPACGVACLKVCWLSSETSTRTATSCPVCSRTVSSMSVGPVTRPGALADENGSRVRESEQAPSARMEATRAQVKGREAERMRRGIVHAIPVRSGAERPKCVPPGPHAGRRAPRHREAQAASRAPPPSGVVTGCARRALAPPARRTRTDNEP